MVTITSSRSHIMANENSNQRGGSGNFANDPERASEAGSNPIKAQVSPTKHSKADPEARAASSAAVQETLPTTGSARARRAARVGSTLKTVASKHSIGGAGVRLRRFFYTLIRAAF